MANIFKDPKEKYPEYSYNYGQLPGPITDPGRIAYPTGGQAAPGVIKPGVGGVNLPGAPGTHYEYTDTGTGRSGTENIGDYRVIQNATPPSTPKKDDPPGGGGGLPYGLGEAPAAGSDLETLLGAIGYTAPGATGGGAVDPRIAQYQQQLQAYLDQYNEPVSYEKTWGDYAYEDLIRQALGMNYTDWTKGDQYAALRDRYTENGRNAMLDTLGQISARTGGLASSYASAASAQQYNEYMRMLEDAARAAYDKERGYVIENAGLAQGVGNQEYNRWYDITGLNNANRDRAVGILNDMLGYAYRDDDTAYSRGMTARDEARDRIASYLGNGGSIGDLDPALITASGLTTPELTKLEAAYQQPAVSYSGGGSGSGSRSSGSSKDKADIAENTGTDWSEADGRFNQFGKDAALNYIKANYKKLGFDNQTQALSSYEDYLLMAGKGSTEESTVSMSEQEIRAGIANQTERDSNGNIIVEIQGNSPYGGTRYLTLAELQRAVENGQVRETTKNGKQVYTWNH